LFSTEAGTPHLYGNLDDRWLTPRLVKMGLDEKGMGWHSFKRFRKTWLRSARCLEDLNNFWMAHKPQTMSEVYSHLHEELQMRLDEAKREARVSSYRLVLQVLLEFSRRCRSRLQPNLQKQKK